MDNNINTTTANWSPSKAKRWLALAAYPLVWAVNRPSAAWLAAAIYDLALRCNGIAINYEGQHGLSAAEERFLGKIAPQIKGGVVFDVGANVGSYTQALLRLAPGVDIHAFEPHPSTFARLAARMAGQKVTLRHQALSDHEAVLELYDFAGADGSTQASLSRAAVAIFDGDIVAHPVRATTIDAYMAETGVAHLALLKIDTEGLDLKVLQGAQAARRGCASGAAANSVLMPPPGRGWARGCRAGAASPPRGSGVPSPAARIAPGRDARQPARPARRCAARPARGSGRGRRAPSLRGGAGRCRAAAAPGQFGALAAGCQAMGFQQRVDRWPADAQKLGRRGQPAAAAHQRAFEGAALGPQANGAQIEIVIGRWWPFQQLQIGRRHQLAIGHECAAPDAVAKFAHIARPVMRQHRLGGALMRAPRGASSGPARHEHC
jgi:FkbM family methyltransferase